MEQETITIICDNEGCRTPYVLSLDTLRAVRWVEVTCKTCGEIQRIVMKEDESIEIYHVS
jgi:RNase P subunit RPR2